MFALVEKLLKAVRSPAKAPETVEPVEREPNENLRRRLARIREDEARAAKEK